MTDSAASRHLFPQIWLIIFGVAAFAAYIAIDRNYLQIMLEADRSRISVLILLIFAAASAHAAWHILRVSWRTDALRKGEEAAATGMMLEVLADRLRAPVEIGWYVVDILIRLGLVGTIIGFILILGTLSDGPEVNAENIQTLLISMSGGMGIALYTTLVGLICASVLGMQYMVLGRCVENLIGEMIRFKGDGMIAKAEE